MVDSVQIEENGKWTPLKAIDSRDDKDRVLSSIHSVNGTPKFYDYDSHNIFFYPKSSSSRNVRVFYSRAAEYFDVTDTTATIGIPRIHHKYLSLNIRVQLNERTNDPNARDLENKLFQEETRIKEWYSKRDEDTPRILKPKILNTFGRRR